MVKELYKQKVKALTDIWSTVLHKWTEIDRPTLIAYLEKVYKERNIRPFRGFKAENLYEKELTSMYVVGKEGLGLFEDNKPVFDKLLYEEERFERIYELLASDRPLEAFQESSMNTDVLARSLRLGFTRAIFSFQDYEVLYNSLRSLDGTGLDPLKHTAASFSRFVTAFLLAEGIAEKRLRDKISLEAEKKAISIRIGIKYPMPKYEYIMLIAREVFGINDKILKKIFGEVKLQ